jgi:hypothetical protein
MSGPSAAEEALLAQLALLRDELVAGRAREEAGLIRIDALLVQVGELTAQALVLKLGKDSSDGLAKRPAVVPRAPVRDASRASSPETGHHPGPGREP